MTDALITPRVLTWARERRKLDIESLASKVNVKPAAVSAWESGGQRPTFRQAINTAKALRVPLGYLYLSKPPDLKSPLPDFRTLPGHSNTAPSPDMLDLIVEVVGKQDWYRENQESEGAVALPFVGRSAADDLPEVVAQDIRDVLGIEEARKIASDSDDFVRELSRNAEDAGIMVMRSGVVGHDTTRPLDVDEFRGFSISDPFAPLFSSTAETQRLRRYSPSSMRWHTYGLVKGEYPLHTRALFQRRKTLALNDSATGLRQRRWSPLSTSWTFGALGHPTSLGGPNSLPDSI